MNSPKAQAGSVSVAYLQGLLDYLARQGIEAAPLLAQVQLPAGILAQREQRVAASTYLQLLELGLARSGDCDLGLHLGEAVRPGYYGVLGYLIMSCPTLADALHRQARYAELVGSLGRVELNDEPLQTGLEPQVAHSWQPLSAQLQRHTSEETLAAWVTFGHWISGLDLAPTLVRFQHPQPADISEHQRIFRCSVLFAQADNALVYPKRLLSAPLGQADAQMRLMLDAYADRQLAELKQGDSLLIRARELLAAQLAAGPVNLPALAAALALSPRTLQRRLGEAGLSFSQLLDETRQPLVLHYLRDPALELADIAFLLGFSEAGSLARAFRRWTGQSPGDYRRSLLAD
ncbi:MAG: AraC family transcriptional regulator [Pseudomonadales bacterium RIFCSPLOWO2_12_59_9]|nr:MAG: AraC family transcriptional regulator [Pseudomonadales bacterium RIFCSPLOWO2_12_59_9]